MSGFPEDTLALRTEWFRRVRESQQGHYACANHFSRLNLGFGVPTVLLSTLAGTAMFTSVAHELVAQEKIIVGFVSIAAATLASLQTFLSFSKRADDHKTTAAKYAAVRRLLKELKTLPPSDPLELKRTIGDIRKEMDTLAESAPEIPSHIKDKIWRDLKERGYDGIYKLLPRTPGTNM
jgi:hypothetical protein